MANYIPQCGIPQRNLHLIISSAAKRANMSGPPMKIPPYIIDDRVIAAIRYKSLNYITAYLNREPRLIRSYFYMSRTTCLDPVMQVYYYMPLLSYALYYGSVSIFNYLIEKSADVNQPICIVEFEEAQQQHKQKLVIRRQSPLTLLYRFVEQMEEKQLMEIFAQLTGKCKSALSEELSIKSQTIINGDMDDLAIFNFVDFYEYLNATVSNLPECMKEPRQKIVEELQEICPIVRSPGNHKNLPSESEVSALSGTEQTDDFSPPKSVSRNATQKSNPTYVLRGVDPVQRTPTATVGTVASRVEYQEVKSSPSSPSRFYEGEQEDEGLREEKPPFEGEESRISKAATSRAISKNTFSPSSRVTTQVSSIPNDETPHLGSPKSQLSKGGSSRAFTQDALVTNEEPDHRGSPEPPLSKGASSRAVTQEAFAAIEETDSPKPPRSKGASSRAVTQEAFVTIEETPDYPGSQEAPLSKGASSRVATQDSLKPHGITSREVTQDTLLPNVLSGRAMTQDLLTPSTSSGRVSNRAISTERLLQRGISQRAVVSPYSLLPDNMFTHLDSEPEDGEESKMIISQYPSQPNTLLPKGAPQTVVSSVSRADTVKDDNMPFPEEEPEVSVNEEYIVVQSREETQTAS